MKSIYSRIQYIFSSASLSHRITRIHEHIISRYAQKEEKGCRRKVAVLEIITRALSLLDAWNYFTWKDSLLKIHLRCTARLRNRSRAKPPSLTLPLSLSLSLPFSVSHSHFLFLALGIMCARQLYRVARARTTRENRTQSVVAFLLHESLHRLSSTRFLAPLKTLSIHFCCLMHSDETYWTLNGMISIKI